MQYRPHNWINIATGETRYGIQGRVAKGRSWLHCADGDKPCLYDTEAERDAKLKELRTREPAAAVKRLFPAAR